jgi:hypothetical protein
VVKRRGGAGGCGKWCSGGLMGVIKVGGLRTVANRWIRRRNDTEIFI